MFIFQVHHYIKPEFVEAYKEATLENARKTVQEPGIVCFDVLQDQKDPAHFSLFEVYRDLQGRADHLETAHLLACKEKVLGQGMFAKKGRSDEFEALFPAEAVW